jgi:hypothetical protein
MVPRRVAGRDDRSLERSAATDHSWSKQRWLATRLAARPRRAIPLSSAEMANGVERELIVSVLPAGLVVLRDSGNDQVLSPRAAIEQALELIHATSLAGQGSGPLSSTY